LALLPASARGDLLLRIFIYAKCFSQVSYALLPFLLAHMAACGAQVGLLFEKITTAKCGACF
jgi:hypothetical protein